MVGPEEADDFVILVDMGIGFPGGDGLGFAVPGAVDLEGSGHHAIIQPQNSFGKGLVQFVILPHQALGCFQFGNYIFSILAVIHRIFSSKYLNFLDLEHVRLYSLY